MHFDDQQTMGTFTKPEWHLKFHNNMNILSLKIV